MSIVITNEVSGQFNSSSYLSNNETSLILTGYKNDTFFGTNKNDVIETSLYDTDQNQIGFQVITASVIGKINKYLYSDVDKNSFNSVYVSSQLNYIQDSNKNLIVDFSDIINQFSINSNNFNLLLNPITNIFSKDNPLYVKEISNSRTEIKLIKTFEEIPSTNVAVTFNGDQILLNGETSSSLASGLVYIFDISENFENIAFSTIKDGTLNGGIDYRNNIIFQENEHKIVVDTTKGIPPLLFIYNKQKINCGSIINFIKSVELEDIELNTQFYSLNNDSLIINQIYDLYVYYLNTFNSPNLYDSLKNVFVSEIQSLKNFYNLTTDSDVINLLHSLYYGETIVDLQIKQRIDFTGIKEYLVNYFNFNYNNLSSIDEIYKKVSRISNVAIKNKLMFLNKSSDNKEVFNQSLKFINSFFDSFFNEIQSSIFEIFNDKFKSPLKSALNFGDNTLFPILSTKIIKSGNSVNDYILIKLKSPLDQSVNIGDTCQISNISISPFFQQIYWEIQNTVKTIKLKNPNFSLKFDDVPKNNNGTIYYNSSSLDQIVSGESPNQISLYKQTSALNIDYSVFKNFIVFSSALARITVFKNKIIKSSILQDDINTLQSVVQGGTTTSEIEVKQNQQNSIIQSFDGYEAYLYNTGNFSYNTSTQIFVDPSTGLSSSYVQDLIESAREYDVQNRDSFINNTPEFVYDDTNNDDYLTFINLIGHMFDNIYVYISSLPTLKSPTHTDVSGSSKNITSLILDSFGFRVPPNSIGDIENLNIPSLYLNSSQNSLLSNEISLDQKTKSIWKRLLVNLPGIYRTKGTLECLNYIFSCYGIPNNLITVKEFGGGYNDSSITSSYIDQTKEYLLQFVGNSEERVQINDLYGYQSLDFKVSLDEKFYTSPYRIVEFFRKIKNGFKSISAGAIKYENNLGSFYFIIRDTSGNKNFVVSDKFNIFTGEPFSILLRKNNINCRFDTSSNASVIPVQYDLVFSKMGVEPTSIVNTYSFFASASLNTVFQDTGSLIFGNHSETGEVSASSFPSLLNINYPSSSFNGTLDRLVVQTAPLSSSTFVYRSENYDYFFDESPQFTYQNILFYLNLGIPTNIYVESTFSQSGHVVTNTSPIYTQYSASLYNFIGKNYSNEIINCVTQSVFNFPYQTREFDVDNQYVTSFIGPSRFENEKTEKISVTTINNTLSPIRSRSIKSKFNLNTDSNKIGLFMSPIQNVNKKILDFVGNYDVMSTVSDPQLRYCSSYPDLKTLRNSYRNNTTQKKILFNELFILYRAYVDKSIFSTINNVLPSRNKVYTGILVEPTILERSKIQNKPLVVDNLKSLNFDLTSSIQIQSDLIDVLNVSIQKPYNVTSSVYSDNFFGLTSYNDTPDKYGKSIFVENGLCEFDGKIYKAFNVQYRLTKNYSLNNSLFGTRLKNFNKITLIQSGSNQSVESDIFNGVSTPTSYSVLNKPYINNLSFKSLPFRKDINIPIQSGTNSTYLAPIFKSRQTSFTTMLDPQSSQRLNPSPVIVTLVGNSLRTTVSGQIIGN